MSIAQIQNAIDHKDELSQAVHNHRIVVDIYCRVSTDDQENNTSLDEQERACREYCQKHGFVVGLVHLEVYSGYYYREREKLALMRKRYHDGVIQGVIVRTFDRLSRKEVHFGILLEEMEHHEVKLHCVREQLEDSLMGRMTRMFLGFLAEWEREKIIDRNTTGRVNKVKEGSIAASGCYKLPWWLKWNDPKKKDFPVINEEKIEGEYSRKDIVVEMCERYADGESCLSLLRNINARAIKPPYQELIEGGRRPRKDGKDAEKWNRRTLTKWFEDPRLISKNVKIFETHRKGAKKQLETIPVPDGFYPAIISEELFERIQERKRINKDDASKNGQCPEEYLLRAGFIKCHCDKVMIGCRKHRINSDGESERYIYACGVCNYIINSKRMDEIVWGWVKQLTDHVDLIEEAIKLATSDTRIIKESQSIDNSLVKWRARAEGYLEDLDDTKLRGDSRAAIREKLNQAQERIEKLEIEQRQVLLGMIDKKQEQEAFEKILEWCKKVKRAREEQPLTYIQKRDFFRMLGLSVQMKKCEQWGKREEHYIIHVSLPEIQALLPHQADQEFEAACSTQIVRTTLI